MSSSYALWVESIVWTSEGKWGSCGSELLPLTHTHNDLNEKCGGGAGGSGRVWWHFTFFTQFTSQHSPQGPLQKSVGRRCLCGYSLQFDPDDLSDLFKYQSYVDIFCPRFSFPPGECFCSLSPYTALGINIPTAAAAVNSNGGSSYSSSNSDSSSSYSSSNITHSIV